MGPGVWGWPRAVREVAVAHAGASEGFVPFLTCPSRSTIAIVSTVTPMTTIRVAFRQPTTRPG